MTTNQKTTITPEMQEWLDYFDWSENDTMVNLPNEIFSDLNNVALKEFNFRHKAFAYSFYYLCCYLYRNAKYGFVTPVTKLFSQDLIEKLYGNRKPINYITKRNGLLDLIGYTSSEYDLPIEIRHDDYLLVDFEMYSEQDFLFKRAFPIPPNFICKKPLKAFHRSSSSTEHDGTFFDFANTHKLDFLVFAKCISQGKIGMESFYVYAFLLAFEDYIKSKDSVYRSYLTLSLGTNLKRINKILEFLEDNGLIEVFSLTPLEYKVCTQLSV